MDVVIYVTLGSHGLLRAARDSKCSKCQTRGNQVIRDGASLYLLIYDDNLEFNLISRVICYLNYLLVIFVCLLDGFYAVSFSKAEKRSAVWPVVRSARNTLDP
jgi:hypothetical protein